jgi:hypothetical protein
MDGLPPSPPAEVRPAYGYAATDIRPRDAQERDLCAKAGSFDWLYVGGALVLNVAAGWEDPKIANNTHMAVRMLGPAMVGTTFGFFTGGTYLALPKCSPDWIETGMPEGQVRTHWQLAISLALLAGAVAPVVQAVEIGGDADTWGDAERSTRVIVSGVTAFGAALLPYLLPPRNWRAARELENLRLRYDTGLRAPVIGYAFTF